MRDIAVVIDQIIEVDPALAVHLSSIRSSVLYTAPEGQSHLWRKLCNVLTEIASDHESRESIRRILSGEQ